MAFAVRRQSSFPAKYPLHSKFKKERTYCTHCKITGHMLDTCFKVGNAATPICSHCNLTGHTMEKCYKLHGYPPGHKLFTKPRGAHVLAAQSTLAPADNSNNVRIGLTQAQYHQLMALLPSGTSSPAQPSTPPDTFFSPPISGINFCLNAHAHTNLSLSHAPWIIDTGATDHMVCCTSFFTTITSVISQSVELPNGTHVFATHVGTVQLTPLICLTQVLCIPSFNFNLLSVKKLSTHLTCCVMFLSDFCFIQDLLSWTTIGKGEVRNGLYHFVNSPVYPSLMVHTLSQYSISQCSVAASASSKQINFDLWHCRLGHPSFPVLSSITDPVVKKQHLCYQWKTLLHLSLSKTSSLTLFL